MAALFHGNPLATPVGQLIERSTDGLQSSENWAMYLEVCDRINETDEGPKDAIKAFRKRLSQNMGKNHTAILYTLTCVETCVKNCGRRFHMQVANKDFLNDMVKVIGPKYDPPQVVQEKVLSLIQTWADAFRGAPELKDIEKVYQDLKAKGIEFPMTDLDSLAPIHTPARTGPEPTRNRGSTTNRSSAYIVEEEEPEEIQAGPPVSGQPPVGSPQPAMPPAVAPVAAPGGGGIPIVGGVPTQEQLAKLRSELDVVQGNVRVMGEMLTELSPSNVDTSDFELLQELNRTNRQMQQRIVELLDGIPNEEVTNELLRVNDDLNNVFLRYERFERYRTGQTGQTQEPAPVSQPAPTTETFAPPPYHESMKPADRPAQPGTANLIDFGEETSAKQVTNQMAQMNVNGGSANPQSDDFDMFAQSRKSFDQNKDRLGEGNTYVNEDQFGEGQGQGLGQAVNIKSQPDSALSATDEEILKLARKLQDKEEDYDEMEKWLEQHEAGVAAAGGGPGGEGRAPEGPISSSEFDKFLTDRAQAAGSLPSISAQTGGAQSRQGNRSRQLQKDDDDNPMFAL